LLLSFIKINIDLSIILGIYTITTVFITPFVYFLNGVGKIKLQYLLSIIAAIGNIPLALILSKHLHFGTVGVISSTLISMLPFMFLMPIQCMKIINNKAIGIWNE